MKVALIICVEVEAADEAEAMNRAVDLFDGDWDITKLDVDFVEGEIEDVEEEEVG